MIRVLIVDDDPLVRAGLALILGGAADVEIVGEAGDGAEGLHVAGRTTPDVVLMDIRMPRMDGLEATARLAERATGPAVIVLTTFDADEQVLRALRAGASGFLLKDTPPAAIVDAVRKVADGEPMLSPSVTATLIRQVSVSSDGDRQRRARAQLDQLTDRELEVAVAVGQGRSNAGHRRRAVHERGDGEGTRVAAAHQARRRQPGAGGDPRTRRRPPVTTPLPSRHLRARAGAGR